MKTKLLFLIVLIIASCRGEIRERSINIGYMGGLNTLDPHMQSEVIASSISSNIFESLVEFSENMVIKPTIAVSWENPDMKTWIFHIRRDVLFHNGDSLSAEDVRFSILRARNHPSSEIRGKLIKVKSIEVIDEDVIKICTVKPDFSLLSKLTSVSILSKKYTEDNDSEYLSSHPVGTGPYRFLEWSRDKYIKLEKFEDYRDREIEIENVVFNFYTNLDEAVEDLLASKISILNNFPCDEIERIEESKDVDLVYTPGLSVRFIGFNISSPVFGRKEVRWAVYHAIDRKRLIDVVRKKYAKEATQLVNPLVYGYNPDIPLIPYDPIKAEKILKDEGFKEGLRMRFLFFEARKKLGETIKEDLRKIGIDVVLVPVPAGNLFKEVKKGGYDAYVASFVSTSGDAEEILCEKIHSRDTRKGYGMLNLEGFQNEKIDIMIESLERVDTPNERLKMMQKIMALVMDEIPNIPLFVCEDLYAIRREIEWKPRLDRYIIVSDISIKNSKR